MGLIGTKRDGCHMPADARGLYLAQLNWYLFEPTEVIFAQFWQFIRKYMADKNYYTEKRLFSEGQTALSLARQGRLMLGQMCSLTYSNCPLEAPTYIGSYILEDATLSAGYYRSIIITSKELKGQKLSALEPANIVAAISEPDSFSGRFALYQALTGNFSPCNFAKTIQTGAHIYTLKAVASAIADIGAIDCLTWRILKTFFPEAVKNVNIVGYSPQMAGPPLVSSFGKGSSGLANLTEAMDAAFSDSLICEQMAMLGILGYVSLEHIHYAGFEGCGV